MTGVNEGNDVVLAKLATCDKAHPWQYDHVKGTLRHADLCLTVAPHYDGDGGSRLVLLPCPAASAAVGPEQVFAFTRYKPEEEGPITFKDLARPVIADKKRDEL